MKRADLLAAIATAPREQRVRKIIDAQPKPPKHTGLKYEAAFHAIEAAANKGAPCPTNEVLAEALDRESANSGSSAMNYFERHGLIRVKRFANRRIVTIVATGKQTADVRADGQPIVGRIRREDLEYTNRISVEGPRATLPHAPCWRCGARGACNHRHPDESFAAPRQQAA